MGYAYLESFFDHFALFYFSSLRFIGVTYMFKGVSSEFLNEELKLYLKMEELANKEAQLILFGSSPFEFAVHFNGRINGTTRKYSIFIRPKAHVVRPSGVSKV